MNLNENASIFTIAQFGNIEEFKKRFNKNIINEKSEIGSNLLHYAIVGRKFDIAKFLLEKNIEINDMNNIGKTPLHYICEFQDILVAKKLLDMGADINIKDKYGNNAMWVAVFNCKGRNYDMVELMMKYNPDIYSKNKAGMSPLDFAKQVGNEKLINILLKINI